jgi:hypothetical protein
MDTNMPPVNYRVYQNKETEAQKDRRIYLGTLKATYEKWVEEISKELRQLIYNSEAGRV